MLAEYGLHERSQSVRVREREMRLVDRVLRMGNVLASEGKPDGARGPGTSERIDAFAGLRSHETVFGIPMLFV